MKEYEIEIEEILQRIIKVEAENKEGAIRKVKEKYKAEEIILDNNDFKSAKFRFL